MKKTAILALVTFFVAFAAQGKPVPESTARMVAFHFLARQIDISPQKLKVVYSQHLPSQGHAAFYVFAAPAGGFAIVAGDDVAQPILAHSCHNLFPSDVPQSVASYLSGLTLEIDDALIHGIQQDAPTAAQWDSLILNIEPAQQDYSSSVSPLLTTTWDQGSLYNAWCPTDANGPSGHVWAGCVATAMAQVIRYWRAPASPRGYHKSTSSYGTHQVNFDNQTYNYNNMPNSLTASSSTAQKREVAKLIYHCGVALDMNWSDTGSSAYMHNARSALINYFGYNSYTGIAARNSYSNSDWINLLKTELNNGRPIIYSGDPTTGSGHAFVCDGYNSSNRFHFNFGWGGWYDGYFALTAITPSTHNFSYAQTAILGANPAWGHRRRFSQQAGTSIHYVSDTLDVYNTLGHNSSYQYSYGVYPNHLMIIQPSDPTKQLLIEPLSSTTYRGVKVWDGSPRVSVLFQNTSNAYSSVPQQTVTSHNAIVIEDAFGNSDFSFRVIVDNGCRMATNLTATASGTRVSLSWQENGTSSQWQVEFGPAGFTRGTGTRVSSSSTTRSISGIPYDTPYDFYVRSSCGGGRYGRWSNRARITLPTPQYTVTATSADPSMGSVSGGGTYAMGSTATLVAQPATGYRFLQWNDGSTANPKTVTVNSDLLFTATFEQITYSITAIANDTALGTVSGGGIYAEGQSVPLQAIPATECRFLQWNDGVTQNPRTVVATSDSLFVAFFEAIPRYTITGVSNDTALGSVQGGGHYLEGTPVTLTAVPATECRFFQWNDGVTQNPRTVVATSDSLFVAFFEAIPKYTITGISNDTTLGSVQGGGHYLEGTPVTLTAVPATDCRFLNWDDGSITNPRTLTATANLTLTAYFAPNSYTVTLGVNDSTMGTVSGGGLFLEGSVATLQAHPDYAHRFLQWDDGVTDNPRLVQVTSDSTFIAIFEALPWFTATITVNDPSMGTVSGEGTFLTGTSITLTATPLPGYHFTYWNDGNTDNPRTLTLYSDTTLIALFESNTYTITVSLNDTAMGLALGSGTYPLNATASIAALPGSRFRFREWSDGNTHNPRTIVVTSDSTFTALLEPVKYTLTVIANDMSMGTALGSGTYDMGTQVSIAAVPVSGYQFARWHDDDTSNPRTVVVSADATYTAYFIETVGIGNAVSADTKVYVEGRHIIAVGGNKGMPIHVFDVMGRCVATIVVGENTYLPTGVYMVKVGELPAKRVVVF